MASQSTKLRLLRSRPLCIVCARPSEAQTIAEILGCENDRLTGREVADVHDSHTFFLGSLPIFDQNGVPKTVQGKPQNIEYYITSSLRQGIQSFATHVGILFHVLKPKVAVHAGVCAGNQEANVNLKNVVFGEAAINYDEGKWVYPNNGKEEVSEAVFQPDYDKITVPSGDMQSFAQNAARPSYRYGDFLSGSAIRQDAPKLFKHMQENVARNAVALDMEASAFLKLCQYVGVMSLGVVKGVSDFGSSSRGRNPDVYEQALQATGKALKEWILHSLPCVEWPRNEDGEPGALIVQGYYENYVRIVLDWLQAGLHVEHAKISPMNRIASEEITGLKVVLPPNKDVRHFAETGQFSQIVKKHGLQEVRIGGGAMFRSVYYKNGYLVDLPRTLTSLGHDHDPAHQVELFQKFLTKKPYFSFPSPMATVCSWEEFAAWAEQESH